MIDIVNMFCALTNGGWPENKAKETVLAIVGLITTANEALQALEMCSDDVAISVRQALQAALQKCEK